MHLRSLTPIRALFAVAALLAAPFSFAFEAVDTLQPASSGRFPAYAGEPVRLSEFWVQGGAMLDSNILRRSNDTPNEQVFRLGVGGRKDTYVYGRQMLRLEGRVDGYLFNRFEELNNLGYGANGEWHWELGNDLSGVLGASRRRYQRDLAHLQSATRDMLTETRYAASGAWRVGPSLRVRGTADNVDRQSERTPELELRTTGAGVGLDYVTALGNFVGVEYRRARGDAPVSQRIDPLGLAVNNDFDEHSAGLAVGYISPFLRLRGNVGRTERTYSAVPGRDFEGTTWRANADWLVTTKTALGFETYRAPQSILDIAASHVLVRGFSFGPGWAPTAKLAFSARLMRERQEFSGDPAAALEPTAVPLRRETVRNMRLGAYWEYTRQIHWTFAIDHGARDSNVPGRDFKYNAVIGNVRYIFW